MFFLPQRVVGLFFGGLNAASTLSVIVVVVYGAYLTITGVMTPGSLTSFILYSLTGASPHCLYPSKLYFNEKILFDLSFILDKTIKEKKTAKLLTGHEQKIDHLLKSIL